MYHPLPHQDPRSSKRLFWNRGRRCLNVVSVICSTLIVVLGLTYHAQIYPFDIAFAQAPLPDLIVSDIRFSVPNPAVGQSTIPQAIISNIGTAASDIMDDVWFYEVDAMGVVIRQLCDTRSAPALAVGETTSIFDVTCTPQTFAQGTHLIQVVLNDVRTINELNYSNNSYTVSLTVGAGANQPPSILIEKPANGITYSSNIDILVTDVNGDAVSVKWCRQAGSIPCSTFANTLTPPSAAIPEFTGMWNVANDANGPYQFCAQAVDAQGAVSRSCVSTALSKPLPPGVPSIPIIEGPTTGAPNQTLSYGAYSTDPAGGEAEYQYDWGDGTKSNWTLPMEIGTQRDIETHAWTTTGVKCLKVTARNPSITTLSSTTSCYNVTISTSPPTTCSDGTANNQCSTNKPKFCSNGSLIDKASQCGCPTGQTAQGDSCTSSSSCTASVSTGAIVTAKVTTTDPDGDQLYYTMNWGDSKTTRAPQGGTVASGFAATVTHKYCDPGTFTATGTATDTNGNTSVASDPLKFCVSGASIPNCDNPNKKGDLTCDGKVDVRDLGVLFHFWGKDTTSTSDCGVPLTSLGVTSPLDTVVGDNDFAVLLSQWD